MLCQLVCVDRRYQRMNCFNIREVESLLKRRFFTDLINSKDHHNLLDKTSVGLRYKLNDSSFLSNNMNLSYNYGLEITKQNRTAEYAGISLFQNLQKFDNVLNFPTNSNFFKFISYLSITGVYNNLIFIVNSIFFFLLEKNFLFIDSSTL